MTQMPKLKRTRKAKRDDNGKIIRRYNDFYSPEMCNRLLPVALGGGHMAAMCLACGIKTEKTFYEYMEKYPEFKEAYEAAKACSKMYYEDLALKLATGDLKGNVTALALIMNNKFSDEYKSTQARAAMEVNIGHITTNNLNTLDRDEIDKRILELQHKLGLDKIPIVVDHETGESDE